MPKEAKRPAAARKNKVYPTYEDFLRRYYPEYSKSEERAAGESPEFIGAALARESLAIIQKSLASVNVK